MGITVEYFDFDVVTEKIWGVTRIKKSTSIYKLVKIFLM